MGQGTARWIAIALVGALVATLAVGLLGGGGGGPEGANADDDTPRPRVAASQALEGPHLWLDLCTGVSCPAVDETTREALVADLEADPRVASTRFVSSEQAYQLFLDEWGDDEELVASVRPEDVPARIEVDLLDPDQADSVVADYADRTGVAAATGARGVRP